MQHASVSTFGQNQCCSRLISGTRLHSKAQKAQRSYLRNRLNRSTEIKCIQMYVYVVFFDISDIYYNEFETKK